MNACQAEMEHVLSASRDPFASQQDWMQLIARVGVLDYLAARLRSGAPAALLRDADFDVHLQAVEAPVARVHATTLAQDTAALREAIGKLKLPCSRIFFKYG